MYIFLCVRVCVCLIKSISQSLWHSLVEPNKCQQHAHNVSATNTNNNKHTKNKTYLLRHTYHTHGGCYVCYLHSRNVVISDCFRYDFLELTLLLLLRLIIFHQRAHSLLAVFAPKIHADALNWFSLFYLRGLSCSLSIHSNNTRFLQHLLSLDCGFLHTDVPVVPIFVHFLSVW